jgi:hypothetical protein
VGLLFSFFGAPCILFSVFSQSTTAAPWLQTIFGDTGSVAIIFCHRLGSFTLRTLFEVISLVIVKSGWHLAS